MRPQLFSSSKDLKFYYQHQGRGGGDGGQMVRVFPSSSMTQVLIGLKSSGSLV